MSDMWLILLLLAGLGAVVVGLMLATGNRPVAADDVEPAMPPADPGAEGMGVAGPGEIIPGAPAKERER